MANKIIAISDAVSRDIVMNRVPRSKIVRVYNGTDFSRFADTCRPIQLNADSILDILYGGR